MLVFTRTKHGADRVVKDLMRAGVRSAAIHGNKSQGARTKALADFRSASSPVLVATDIASRGIDVDDVSHVFNFDVPHEAETYVHRIGRTARAGTSGKAVSFCDHDERSNLRAIERLIRQNIEVMTDQPKFSQEAPQPGDEQSDRPAKKPGGQKFGGHKPGGHKPGGFKPKSRKPGGQFDAHRKAKFKKKAKQMKAMSGTP